MFVAVKVGFKMAGLLKPAVGLQEKLPVAVPLSCVEVPKQAFKFCAEPAGGQHALKATSSMAKSLP